ncbi:MAG: 50S ribosomal protein L21 [Patescibacteria group bacterium]|nr:50S ribosomal protein L21 [Patescibacteria group bacterium]
MFAVVSYKGNQYKLALNKEHKIDLVDDLGDNKKKITFSEVLAANDGNKNIIGTPVIKDAFVEADFVKNISDEKALVFKFKAKKRYKRTQGHRQPYTLIKVTNISLKNEK